MSGTSSRCDSGLRPRAGVGRAWALLGLVGGLAGVPAPARAQVLLTQQEALRLAFPEPATILRRTAYLDEGQLEAARALAGPRVQVNQTVVTYYVGLADGKPLGAAYFDAHRVRTLPEVVMIVVTPEAQIERVEVLKFAEPPQYLLPESWIRQLRGRELTEDLALKRAIVNMTGATLSAQAITGAARRVLALHRVIRPFERAAAEPGAGGTGGRG